MLARRYGIRPSALAAGEMDDLQFDFLVAFCGSKAEARNAQAQARASGNGRRR